MGAFLEGENSGQIGTRFDNSGVSESEVLMQRRTYPKLGKVLHLLKFRKALMDESYEECIYWKGRALERGASRRDIARIIEFPELPVEELCLSS